MQQAEDFRAESRALAAILKDLDEAGFDRPTLFKGWTIDDVIGHLHLFNVAAAETLKGPEVFGRFIAPLLAGMKAGRSLRDLQYPWLDGLRGRALYAAWKSTAEDLADAYAATDPKARVAWVGPEMSALSSITARQMETWAHGQEIFDALGLDRVDSDRIRNIAHLGVVTYGWSFRNRGQEAPAPAPHVVLTAPSGAVWTWNEPQDDNVVRGSAVEFAQVVTQVRALADTGLVATGGPAGDWMRIAQCFAGPVETPPAPGSRHKA